jgi:UDP-2,3-diacylglucosamine hydrolase
MAMRKIFIADAHLRHPDDPNYRLLLQFLHSLDREVEALYILGDLFEFWIGYRTMPYPHYGPVLDALHRLVANGTRLVYFEGNHDFHMGPWFQRFLKADIHRGPAILDIEGRRVCLCHGDEVNRQDYPYRLLRCVFHSKAVRLLTYLIPARLPVAVADALGEASRKNHPVRRLKWDYTALLRTHALQRFAEGCDIVATGHFHNPYSETIGGQTMVCLGDWLTHFTYGEWEKGTIVLKKFRPGS